MPEVTIPDFVFTNPHIYLKNYARISLVRNKVSCSLLT